VSTGFCEKLFSKLSGKNDRWEVRLMKLNLITRIIGVHQLTLLALYPFLIKYLQPSQRDVTMVLVSAAQATHTLVPPDVLEPVLRAIANNFVTDRVSNEVMTAG
jgi:protein SDA1